MWTPWADSTAPQAVLFNKSEQEELWGSRGKQRTLVPSAETSQGRRGKTRGKRDALPFGQIVHPHLLHQEDNKKHARGPASDVL